MLSDDELNQSVSEYFERVSAFKFVSTRDLCSRQFGEIVLVKVLRDAHNRPYAFVQFSSDGEANEALEHGHHAMLNGRRIRCERARVNRTLFCTPLIPGNASLDRIKEKLETFGETEDIMAANNVGRRPAWFVKFVYRDDAIRAYANLTSDPAWRVEWAQNVDRMRVCIDTRSVFVSSLSPDTTEKLLEERFGRHGAIETCRVYSKTRGDDSTLCSLLLIRSI
jgi:RNA recognition motif-containing protein